MFAQFFFFLLYWCNVLGFGVTSYKGRDDDGKYDGKPMVLLIFVVFGIALGGLTTQILSRSQILLPYTVVIFLLGIAISAIVDNFDLGDFGHSTRRWIDLNPELLLYLFLPVLIFGEAMSLKWHHVKGGFLQSLLLAGPGVIMGAVFMALFLYFFIPLGWNWNICMLLGSILAATDPVAVVALLKNAGASPKLTILIIGESLMNDGTAMVLFTLYYNMMEGKHYSGGGIIVFFLSTCIGSPLLGIAFGLAGVFWLGRANRPLSGDDVTIQIVITVCVAYLVFYVAQFQCEMSGVLACCGAGCVFAYLAPPLILEHETMHNVWGFMEWFANTLIFLLSGLIIGSETQTNITTIDWLYVFILYIFLLIIRCVIIWILFPALKNIGLKCSKKDAIFMAWSGLRGALGMTLSLIVYSNRDDLDMSKDDANKVFFYVGGIASLTLIINATSAQNVLNYLGLLKEDDSPEMINIIHQANRNLRMRGLEIAHKLENDKYHISMDDLMEYNSIIRNEAESECRNSKALENMRKKSYSRRERPEDVTQDTLRYCRTMFLDCVRSKYWKFIEEGKMPRQSRVTQILLYSIDNALDRVNKKGLRDWKLIRKELQMNSTLAAVTDAIRDYTPTFFPFHFLGDLLTTKNIYLRVYIITSFIDAHEDAQKQFYHFMSDLPDNDDEHNDTTGQDKVYTMEQRTVIEESIASVREAREMLMAIDPDVVTSIVSQQTARIILARQTNHVVEMVEEGLLQPKAADEFFDIIRNDILRLDEAKVNVFRNNVILTASRRASGHLNEYLINAYRNHEASVDIAYQHSKDVTQPLLHRSYM